MKEILTLLQLQQEGKVHLATIGGFDLVYAGEMIGKGDSYRYETLLQRTGADYEIELAITVTPLGAVSRLEHGLNGFEEEQRRYRQRLDEAKRRLRSYLSRDGGTFMFADHDQHMRPRMSDPLSLTRRSSFKMGGELFRPAVRKRFLQMIQESRHAGAEQSPRRIERPKVDLGTLDIS